MELFTWLKTIEVMNCNELPIPHRYAPPPQKGGMVAELRRSTKSVPFTVWQHSLSKSEVTYWNCAQLGKGSTFLSDLLKGLPEPSWGQPRSPWLPAMLPQAQKLQSWWPPSNSHLLQESYKDNGCCLSICSDIKQVFDWVIPPFGHRDLKPNGSPPFITKEERLFIQKGVELCAKVKYSVYFSFFKLWPTGKWDTDSLVFLFTDSTSSPKHGWEHRPKQAHLLVKYHNRGVRHPQLKSYKTEHWESLSGSHRKRDECVQWNNEG